MIVFSFVNIFMKKKVFRFTPQIMKKYDKVFRNEREFFIKKTKYEKNMSGRATFPSGSIKNQSNHLLPPTISMTNEDIIQMLFLQNQELLSAVKTMRKRM